MAPRDRRYTKEHEWLIIEDNQVKIGITDHAQDALGDIVFVELPSVNESFSAGDSFAVVESVKTVSPIYTSITGTVIEVNTELEATPELLNSAPYDTFIAAFKADEIDLSRLLTAEEYDAFLASEA